MTEQEIEEQKAIIAKHVRDALEGQFIGQPVSDVTVALVKSQLMEFLKSRTHMAGQSVFEELTWDVSVNGNILNARLVPKTERAEKFLRGEEFW